MSSRSVLGLYASFGAMSPTGRPPFVTVPWCSFAASHAALHGILSALFERESSGRGQWVEANLAQALTIHEGASSSWYGYLVSQRWPDAYVAAPSVSEAGVPMHHFVYRLLVGQTTDGRWLQFAQNRPHLFEAFLRALGLEWMLTDPRWKGIPILDDEELRVELLQVMLAGVRDRTLTEWQDVFDRDHDVFAELYRCGPEVLEHPQFVHDAAIVEINDAERGPVRQPGAQFRMTATPAVLPGGRADTGRLGRNRVGRPPGRVGVARAGGSPAARRGDDPGAGGAVRRSLRRDPAGRPRRAASSRSSRWRVTRSVGSRRSSPRSAVGSRCRARTASPSTSGRPKASRSSTGWRRTSTRSLTASAPARPNAAASTPRRCAGSIPISCT